MGKGKKRGPEEIEERMRALALELRRHNDLYYNEGRSELTDSEYDALARELRELEEAHPEVSVLGSPSQEVGAPLPRGRGFEKLKHRVPMLSLDSLTSSQEVLEFEERIRKGLDLEPEDPLEYVLEPKYDGVSASLFYEDGKLVHGLTRGDGRQGERITENLLRVRGIPAVLAGDSALWPKRIEIRGEVILSQPRFQEIREEQEERGEQPFRNARNAVAGSLKRLDGRGLEKLGIDFFFWGTGDLEGLDELQSYRELAERIESYGFAISPELETADGVQGILEYHDRLESRREELPFEMDGIVAKLDSLESQRLLGRTARTPRWSLAYKFAPRKARTRVQDITVQVGRTGALTPVAHLEPVELAGVTVQRATLHNFDLLTDRDVRVGDEVEIERAGDVIPEVTRVFVDARDKKSEAFPIPSLCPVCESDVAKEGAFLYCLNIDCSAQITRRITHLSARRALDIDRLGPKYVDQLFEAGLIERVEDVFRLPERRDEILALDRWGEKSLENLEQEIERAKRPTLARFLFALGIRHVGEKVAADLAEAFGTLAAVQESSVEQLVEVEGIGDVVAEEIHSFFRLPSTLSFFRALDEAGVEVQALERADSEQGGALVGRIFCFTGGLESMSRDQARERVEAMGASTASSISKRVTDVVIGSKAGSKREKAEKLGLTLHDEEQFLALLEKLGAGAT